MRILKGVILLVVLVLSGISTLPHTKALTQLNIDVSAGDRSGDVQLAPWLGVWYTWVSIQGVQMLFLALHSPSQVYNAPVFSLIGQAYNTTAGSRIFVGNLLLLMEAYNDSDLNGILDANYTAGTTEAQYVIEMNSSATFDATPVSETVLNNVTHYQWGIRYGDVDAGLNFPSGFRTDSNGFPTNFASSIMISYVAFSYDYSIAQNTTSLKTTFKLGNMTITPPTLFRNVSLTGLSLDLLYSTVVVSPRQYDVISGNTVIDSSHLTVPGLALNSAQLKIGDSTAYQFLFGENYTLFQSAPSTHMAISAAVSHSSVPISLFAGPLFGRLNVLQYYVSNSLPLIGNLPAESDLKYNSSRFFYRVSYPQWSGYALEHDPTYIAYFIPALSTPATLPPLPTVILVAGTGVIALILALLRFRRPQSKELALTTSQDASLTAN